MQSKTLFLDITSNCNLKCKICYNSRYFDCHTETFNFNTFCNTINFDNLKRIHILGGEPLLSNHLYKVLEIANRKNIKVSINTNAVLLNTDLFKRLLNYKCLDQISISLDGGTSKENDFFRGNGVFKKVMDNLEKIRNIKSKININIACVITNYNIRNLKKLCSYRHLYDSLLFSKIFFEGKARDNNFFVKPYYFFKYIIDLIFELNSNQIDYQIDLLPIELNWILLNLNLPLIEHVENSNCYNTKLFYSANNELFPCNPSSFYKELYKLPNPKAIIKNQICKRDCFFNNKCKICNLKNNNYEFTYCDYVLKKVNHIFYKTVNSNLNTILCKFLFPINKSIYYINFDKKIKYKIVDTFSGSFYNLNDLYKKVSISDRNKIKLIIAGLINSSILKL